MRAAARRNPVRVATAGVLCIVAAGACSWPEGPIVETIGPPVVVGPLTLTPIRYAETEYWLIPTPRKLIPGPRTLEAEEGSLRVPTRHAGPSADSITIHFVRFKSTSEHPGPPIVYLAGGPGGSGTRSSAGDRFDVFQALRAVGDVIALDQRGTHLTDPYLVCPDSWDYPLDQPTELAIMRDAIGPFLRACYAHWSDSVDVQAFNTRESAADLDDLRAALGADRLVLWGISYGTHLALAYIRQFPDRVAAAILAGTEGPDHTYKLPANLDRILVRVDSAMKADPKLSAVLPDFLTDLRGLLARLEERPERIAFVDPDTSDSVTVVIGADDLRRGVFLDLGEREDVVAFPRRIIPILRGDFSAIAPLVARGRRGMRELAMTVAMDCSSGASAERLALIEQQAATAILGDAGNIGLRAHCAHWPVDELGDEYRSPVTSAVPALFISGTLDFRTPPSNAEEVRRGFPNSHHLVIDGGSHDDDLILESPVILETMLAFLRGETTLQERVVLPPIRFKRP
ncbi:MAG: alpha/beta hydrolase [Gemmatimonadota bacterium]|nr:alpha/beta hydrolase [Gemmatimonadota bacterium]